MLSFEVLIEEGVDAFEGERFLVVAVYHKIAILIVPANHITNILKRIPTDSSIR